MLYDFIVIGAGAAGLFFSANYAKGSVLLLEKQNRAGRKILLSGGGKCNITNRDISAANYLCSRPGFVAPALKAVCPEFILEFFGQRGIDFEEREHGQMFCLRGAEEVRDVLLNEAAKHGTHPRYGQNIEQICELSSGVYSGFMTESYKANPNMPPARSPDVSPHLVSDMPLGALQEGGARFAVQSNGQLYYAKNLLLACGGKAWPAAGANSSAYTYAAALGHNVIALAPALCPLKIDARWALHGLQGISLKTRVSVSGSYGRASFTLPLLFTHSGISGPACLQASSYLERNAELEIDFLPEAQITTLLENAERSKATLAGVLKREFPVRFAEAVIAAAGVESYAESRVAQLPKKVRQALAESLHRQRVKPLDKSFAQAESTSGGVDTAEVSPKTLQSALVPGLYFAGELLDVCGQLGGYNLHWAWASGFLCSRV